MSRKKALANYSTQDVVKEMVKQQVVLETRSMKDIADESPFVYKDIDEVMEQMRELAVPALKLKTAAVIKG